MTNTEVAISEMSFDVKTGSKHDILPPLYDITAECEAHLFSHLVRKSKTGLQEFAVAKSSSLNINEDVSWDVFPQAFSLQSGVDPDSYRIEMNKILKMWNLYINKNQGVIKQWLSDSNISCCVENILQLLFWYQKCNNYSDYEMLTRMAYKLITGKSLFREIFVKFFPPADNLQSDFADNIAFLRGIFDTANQSVKSPMVEKITRMYAYLATQGFLKSMDMEISEREFTLLETTYVRKEYTSRFGMVMHAIDLAIFLCERLCVYRATGEISTFLHTSSTYSDWLVEADKLLALAPFTSNLSAHGTTYFTFLSDLNSAIEKGVAISKYSQKNNGTESLVIKRKLMSLQMIKNTEVTRKAAQKERRAPFGVLVHGSSSVAKSSFTKMLFYYYGSLFGLDKDDHYRYVRNPAEEYWNNFDSSKWCIQMDDVAFLLPSATGDVDPTLKELLNVVNNVPYVPAQAALEDKGKTPVMARVVIATSNAADLNAHEYFFCPLAVRRRLPFVVHVEPKDEYLHENRKFIDPTKLPTENTGYPNFWRITVQRLCPITQGKRDWAKLETVQVYDDVMDFLKFYGSQAREHEANQDKSMVCDNYMKDIAVCPCCMNVSTACECSLQSEQDASERFLDWVVHYMVTIILWVYSFGFVKTMCRPMLQQRIVRYATIKICLPFLTRDQQVRMMGFFNELRLNSKKKYTLMMLSLTGFALVGFFMSYSSKKENEPEQVGDKCKNKVFAMDSLNTDKRIVVNVSCNNIISTPTGETKVPARLDGNEHDSDSDDEEYIVIDVEGKKKRVVRRYLESITEDVDEMDTQGNVYGTLETQLEKEEKQNVWYNPTVELTNFDMPISSTSLVGKNPYELREAFQRNCVRLDIKCLDSDRKCRTGGVMLGGQVCLFNTHVLHDDENFEFTVIQTDPSKGLNSNITFTVTREQMQHNKSHDLSVVLITSLPPFKDITRFWAEGDIPVSRLCMLKRENDASMRVLDVHGVVKRSSFPIEALGIEVELLMGLGEVPTQAGDCGSLAIAMTPRGPVMVGLHTVGYNNTLGVPYVTKKVIDELTVALVPKKFVVQGGGSPMLGLKNEIRLATPHHKSLVRYLSAGHVNVYGSFTGFRPKPKSKVVSTPFCEEFCSHFNTEIKHGKPAMSGWEPWRKNLVEMVRPTVKHDRSILKKCVEAFTKDIVDGLHDGWEKELVFLSKKAAVNGLPGVKYIDRLNTSSSMGFPWNTTKKSHLVPAIDELYPEGVDFTPEVWERVDKILEKYSRGERAYPIFTGHLKDEATPFAKCESKKTRLFTGGPVDWSIVVRSRLLSFVRLVQKNKFLFEAAPGLVTQSTEWAEVRDYLTAFGPDQLVGGDYRFYDKRMIADFVLAAFEIIANIFEAAGFSEEEVREILCIGNDIAFPLVNFNGDLLEFFGTNPSGHPLTVIINSLVNALYMRYAYAVLGYDLAKFKRLVHLLTYGDDNAMGVSKEAPGFNHTVIQAVLEDIGVTYTMADKESESRPYIHIDECSFLKRTWRMDEDVGTYLAPLDEASIHRSLTMWVPSGTINKYEQMVEVIVAANNEYFFYGKETFQRHHEFFREILKCAPYSAYVTDSTLPTWQDLYERFWRASGKPVQPVCSLG